MNIIEVKNCNQLIELLISSYQTCQHTRLIEFQGEICEIGGAMPQTDGLFLMNPNYPMTVFIVGQDNRDGSFYLYLFMGREFIFDQTLCAVLPISVRDELIATIKGE